MARPVLRGVALGADGEAGRRLGLHVRDGRSVVGGVVLAWTGSGGGLQGLDLAGVAAADVLPHVAVAGDRAPAPPDDHPLGAVAVDHVVVLTGDVVATLDALGVRARRSEQRDGRAYAWVVAGRALLELVGPVVPDARPPRLWGLALSVADLDAAVALLGVAVGPPRDAVQPGRRIATVDHAALGLGAPLALLSART